MRSDCMLWSYFLASRLRQSFSIGLFSERTSQVAGTGRSSASGKPFTYQRGFAKTSGGRDERQFAVQPLVEPLEQAGAADHVGPRPRDIQFRGENGRGHGCFCSWPLRPAFFFSSFFRARENRYKQWCDAFKSTYVGGLHPFLHEAPEGLLPCS